jgi:hypothetical protein
MGDVDGAVRMYEQALAAGGDDSGTRASLYPSLYLSSFLSLSGSLAPCRSLALLLDVDGAVRTYEQALAAGGDDSGTSVERLRLKNCVN